MILILTDESYWHAHDVEHKLRERGAKFLRFDPGQFPSNASLSLAYSDNEHSRSMLSLGNQSIDLNSVTTVWYRRPTASVPHEEITEELKRDYIADECNIVMQDLWNSMECFWLPAPQPVIRKAEFKASQLGIAKSLGFGSCPPRYSPTIRQSSWTFTGSTMATS